MCIAVGQNALELGLNGILKASNARVSSEHHRFPSGTGGDRPTPERLAACGLN